MKYRFLGVSLILITFFFSPLFGQDTLLLFHPTAYNLEVIQKLLDEKVLDLEEYHILGVYHEKEIYDYAKAEEYVRLHPNDGFSLREVAGTLEPGNIYAKNPCTSQISALFSLSRGALFKG
jgi:hypothetical protein